MIHMNHETVHSRPLSREVVSMRVELDQTFVINILSGRLMLPNLQSKCMDFIHRQYVYDQCAFKLQCIGALHVILRIPFDYMVCMPEQHKIIMHTHIW